MEAQAGRTILAGATLIDGTGAAPVPNATVVVEEDRIVLVDRGRPEDLGLEGDVIDGRGKFLLPGLIDMHLHATFYYSRHDAKRYTEALIAMLAVWQLQRVLRAGVTTAREPGGVNRVPMDVRTAITKGFHVGPRYYVAGNLIVPSGGHCAHAQLDLPGLSMSWNGTEGVRQGVREQIRAGVNFIKLANAPMVDFTEEEVIAAVDEAHRLGYKVACHSTTASGTKTAIAAGVDTLEHGTYLDEADAEHMAAKGITLDPTLRTGEITTRIYERRLTNPDITPDQRQETRQALERRKGMSETRHASFQRAVAAGVRITAGTDYNIPPDCDREGLAEEVIALVEHGCPTMRALQAATGNAAAAMGWDEIGTVAAGKKADLILLSHDPLADVRHLRTVELVMLDGRIVHTTDTLSATGHDGAVEAFRLMPV